jgi:hypothetical protein
MNYIGITNWSEHPNIKGLIIDDGRLIRSFCLCGYVINSVISECPCCGNTNFIKGKKWQKENKLEPCGNNHYDDVLQITEYSHSYDISRCQSAATHIVIKKETPRASTISNCGYEKVKPFLDEPEFNAFAPYAVAKEVFDVYKGSTWSDVVKMCLGFYRHGKDIFSRDVVFNELEQMGDNIPMKIRMISQWYSTNPYEYVPKLNKASDSLRLACDNPNVFNDFTAGRYPNTQFLYDDIVNLVHSYWKGGYISSQNESSILKSIAEIGIDKTNVQCFLKFFKEEYAAMSNSTCCLQEFLCYLKNNPNSSVKDYFLNTNRKIVNKAFKQKDIDDALTDIYQNPAFFFINLMK